MRRKRPESILVADIGGTNARFALFLDQGERPMLHAQRSLPTADFASLQQAAQHYLESAGARPSRAAIAVACPVQGEDIRLTNRAWSFNREELRLALDLDELLVINDFGAAARALPALDHKEFECLHGEPDAPLQAPVSVIGPGTGMGMALLTDCPVTRWRVIETEGGHASFAPLGSEEQRIHDWLTERIGQRISIERLLSGRGLSRIHGALAGIPAGFSRTPHEALMPPPEVVRLALAGEDRTARDALARFCAILGSVAGDTALIHGARTVAIAGGIVPRFIPFLRTSAFRERFLDKGRFAAYLENVRILVVTHPDPGLLGAALQLQDSDRLKAQA